MNEENKQYEEDGVSIGQIFHWIWLKKIILLIITGVIFLVTVLYFMLSYNPNRSTYMMKFKYVNVPNILDGKYLDGRTFNFENLISYDNFSYIKNSKEEYNSINLEKFFKSNKLKIVDHKIHEKADDSTSPVIDRYFEIYVPAQYFSGEAQATNFLKDVINIPLDKTEAIISELKFDANFELIKLSKTYNIELNNIQNQANLILNGYSDLESKYGNVSIYLNKNSEVVENPTEGVQYKISQLRTRLINLLEYHNYYALSTELSAKGYVKDPSYEKTFLDNRIKSLTEANKDLDVKITEYQNQLNSILDIPSSNQIIMTDAIKGIVDRISNLADQKSTNQVEINECQRKLAAISNEAENAEFGKRLDRLTEDLIRETKTYTNVAKYIYARDMNIIYANSKGLVASGGRSLVVVSAIGLFGGLLVGCVVSGIVGYNQEKKQKIKKEENLISE